MKLSPCLVRRNPNSVAVELTCGCGFWIVAPLSLRSSNRWGPVASPAPATRSNFT